MPPAPAQEDRLIHSSYNDQVSLRSRLIVSYLHLNQAHSPRCSMADLGLQRMLARYSDFPTNCSHQTWFGRGDQAVVLINRWCRRKPHGLVRIDVKWCLGRKAQLASPFQRLHCIFLTRSTTRTVSPYRVQSWLVRLMNPTYSGAAWRYFDGGRVFARKWVKL